MKKLDVTELTNFNGIFNVYLFIFRRERERERERAGEGQRERIPSRLCTVSPGPDAGLKFINHEIMT